MTYSIAIKILTTFILLMLIVAAAPFFYYKFYPFRPVTDLNSPFPVDKTVVKPGEEISWTTKFCKNDSATVRTTIKLVTQLQQINLVTDKEFKGDEGCYEIPRSAIIPQEAATAEATIEFYSEYLYPFGRVVPARARTVIFQIESANKTAPVNPVIRQTPVNISVEQTNPVSPTITNTPTQNQPNNQNQPTNQNPTVNTNVSTQITTPNICVPIINLCL